MSDPEGDSLQNEIGRSINPKEVLAAFRTPPPTGREFFRYIGEGSLQIGIAGVEIIVTALLFDHLNGGRGVIGAQILILAAEPFVLGPINRRILTRLGIPLRY